MEKVLLIAPMSSVHQKFNGALIEVLAERGSEIHLMADFEMNDSTKSFAKTAEAKGMVIHTYPFQRGSLWKNLKAIPFIKGLLKTEHFNIVHAHTETGGILLRLAMLRGKAKYIYTPHGMSFYKGGPLIGHLLYKPIEKWICSGMDANIAINQEELYYLKKWNTKSAFYTHGIGIDTSRFKPSAVDVKKKKVELGLPIDSVILLSVGELNNNKNHKTIIEALSIIKEKLPPNFYYLVCGKGPQKEKLEKLAQQYGLESIVKLLGYRTDIVEFYPIASYFTFPSYHEGLPVSVMEAMSIGLPILASNIRGVVDMIKDGENGFLCNPQDNKQFAEKLLVFLSSSEVCKKMGAYSQKYVELYDKKNVRTEIKKIYSNF